MAAQHNFAPSVPAGSHEMRDYYSDQDPPRPSPHTAPSITPYLGLRARLSQIWFNRWTILLLLVLARTLIAISGIENDLSSARREALSACSSVESMGSAMASMPHYMSQGANELSARGVEKAVTGLMEMTMMSVTGVEEIVVFIINTLTSTYACLITLAVTGGITAGVNVIEDAQQFLGNNADQIGDDMAEALKQFGTLYNATVDDLKTVVASFGGSVKFPQIDLSSQITTLRNLKLPTDNLTPKLDEIKNNLPTFKEVQNATDNVIRIPFETVKGLISDHFGNYSFDASAFPIPAKEDLTFCSDNNGISDFFDDLTHLAAVARTIFIGVLVAAAVLVCIPMAWREIKRWRTMQERSQLVRSAAHDPMDVVYIVSRPYTSTAGIKLANTFNLTRRQILTRWVFAYATSDAALFVLSLAIAGFFSVACQAILLKSLEKEVPDLTNQVGAFADKVVSRLNNASEEWAVGTNGVINSLNADINDKMLGWVNITTSAINDTLNLFVSETSDVLNTTFGGTIFYEPIKDVLDCLVLLKVAGVQKALTWVSDNAHVNFPGMPDNMFSLGAAASIAQSNSDPSNSFLATPGDEASDKISSAVARFIIRLEDAIRVEAAVAAVILAIWVLIVVIGIIRALTLWFGRDKVRGEGGTADFRSGPQTSEFHEIPLGAVRADRPFTPAPQYSTAMAEGKNPLHMTWDENPEQIYGFAGQRDYQSSVSRQTTIPGKGRIQSSRVEVTSWNDDKK